MKRAKLLLAALVVAHVALHIVAVRYVSQVRMAGVTYRLTFEDYLYYSLFMVATCQGTLFAMWIALGGRGTAWRVLLALLDIIVYLWLCRSADPDWLWIVVVQTVAMSLILLLGRHSGLALVHLARAGDTGNASQFSLRDIFVWTTVFAIILSVLRCYGTGLIRILMQQPVEMAQWIVTCYGGYCLIAFACIWLALGARHIIVRLCALPVAVTLAAVWFSAVLGRSQLFVLPIIWESSYAVLLLGSLLVVRLAGYRLSWHWRFGRSLA